MRFKVRIKEEIWFLRWTEKCSILIAHWRIIYEFSSILQQKSAKFFDLYSLVFSFPHTAVWLYGRWSLLVKLVEFQNPKSARTANRYRRGRGERVWLWIGQWSHQSKDHGSGRDSLKWNILTIRLNAHIRIHSNWNPRNPLWDNPSSWSILAVFTSHQGTGMKGIGIAKFFFVMNADRFPLLRLRFRRVSIVICWSLPLTIRLENRLSHFRIHHGYQTVQ